MRHVLLLILIGLCSCSPEYVSEAVLTHGSASMKVRPMIGIHSDWHREFVIGNGTSSKSRNLFDDSGWWRGSHLYLHRSGTYVVHEGQAGCFRFALETLSFDVGQNISCVKVRTPASQVPGDKMEIRGYPASKFYKGFYYVGRFFEAGYQSHQQHGEVELPKVL